MNYRTAQPEDAAACVALRGKTRENAVSPERLRAMGITVASWGEDIRSGALPGHVCTVQGQIVGYCFGASATGEVVVLALLPDFENQGIGRALLHRVVTHLRGLGRARLFLGCSSDPTSRSYGFYRHLGWRSTGTFDTHGDEVLELLPGPTPAGRLHIGIVACSAEGAALCYRTICAEGAALMGPHAHPEVSLHSASLADYVQCLEAHDMPGIAQLMLGSARKLAAAGADLLICPDNTIHQAFSLVAPVSPLPWLHIAQVVASEAVDRGYRTLGLLGTRWLVASEVYPQALGARGLACVRPSDADRDEIGRRIMDELVYGVFRPETVALFQQVIDDLKRRGCDAVVLGCTEIPLIIHDANASLPTLDSTRLLARAALRQATALPTRPPEFQHGDNVTQPHP